MPASYRQRHSIVGQAKSKPRNVPPVTTLASGVWTHLLAQSVAVFTLLIFHGDKANANKRAGLREEEDDEKNGNVVSDTYFLNSPHS